MTTTASEMRVRFLGTTDEVETCDCCGKSNLKVTVALLFPQADEPVYFGTTCAARALSMPAKDIRKAAKSIDDAHAEALREARDRQDRVEHARWATFCKTFAPNGDKYGTSLLHWIEALGGFRAARDAYMTHLHSMAQYDDAALAA